MGTPSTLGPVLPGMATIAPPNALDNGNNQTFNHQQAQNNWQQHTAQANHPPMAHYNLSSQVQSTSSSSSLDKHPVYQNQQSPDPLVSILSVSTVPGNQPEPILSMNVSQSIKKCIWAWEYIDLAYLLETDLVPEEEKSYEFACSSHSFKKLSLTMAKPKAKIEMYNAWNKGSNQNSCPERSNTMLGNGAVCG